MKSNFKCPQCGRTENSPSGKRWIEFWQNKDDGLNMGKCHGCGYTDDGVVFEATIDNPVCPKCKDKCVGIGQNITSNKFEGICHNCGHTGMAEEFAPEVTR